jgi:hypothetical protein
MMGRPDPAVKRRSARASAPARARATPGAVAVAAAAVAVLLMPSGVACGRRIELLAKVPLPAAPRLAAPRIVAAISDAAAIDEDPTFTADLVELYFMSNRTGTKDIWTSRRAAAGDAWGTPALVAELSTPADNDWSPCVSSSGLSIWFASDRAGGRGKIWFSSRPRRTDAWSPPALVAELSGDDVDFAPAVDATETMMLFSSNRTGSAGYDIYLSTRASPGAAWGPPAAVAPLDSGSDEYDPFVARAGLIVFFTSMRSGMGDLYWSSRASAADPFAPPTRLDDADSDAYDSDSTLSADLGYMMFSSTRSGNAEIYETTAVTN